MSIRAVFFDFGGVIQRTEFQAPRQHLGERFRMDYEDIDKLVFGSESARRASVDSFGALLPGVGLLGLIVGAVRRHKPAIGLLALALTHVAGLGLAFSNPRLALPATLAATLGWCST